MRLPILLLVPLLAACSGNSGTTAATRAPAPPSSSPAASPSVAAAAPSPSRPAPQRELLAFGGGVGVLDLYGLEPGSHAATLVRRLSGPSGMHVWHVSLSGGGEPTTCAVWTVEPGDDRLAELRCYRPGATAGRTVARARAFDGVSVRADGRALAWTEQTANGALVVADLAGDVATVRSRQRYSAAQPPDGGVPASIEDVDWLAPRTLAGTDDADSDEGKGVCVIDVAESRPKDAFGFGRCIHPDRTESDKGYARFEGAVPVASGEIVAVERAAGCCSFDDSHDPPSRAVRVRLSDGAVLGVVATARTDRVLVDVSGGSRCVVYVTYGAKDDSRIASARWAGESHGAPITGITRDLQVIAAQP